MESSKEQGKHEFQGSKRQHCRSYTLLYHAYMFVYLQVIAFFPTARQTQVYAEAFNLAGIPVFEIHSRKSQAQRTKTSDQ
jgi:superfamily II DNA/RNA helicase